MSDKTTKKQRNFATKLYKSGASGEEVGKAIGISGTGALKIMEDRGVKRDREFNADKYDDIKKLYELGFGSRNIARIVGGHIKGIERFIKENRFVRGPKKSKSDFLQYIKENNIQALEINEWKKSNEE